MTGVKKLTDDRELLIKELEKQYTENDVPDDVKPTKYDQGTGTYYADEELAREKMASKQIILNQEPEKPKEDKTLEEMLNIFVDANTADPVVKKKGVAMYKQGDGSKWHSR